MLVAVELVAGKVAILRSALTRLFLKVQEMVHGNVESGSTVYVKKGAHILGNVIAKAIVLHEEAKVDGTIQAPHGMRIERGP